MAAALGRSTVGEVLEGLPISDHKCNMAAALTSLMGNFQTENEALEGLSISDLQRNMAAPVASLTEKLQSLNEVLEKEKNHLLQRVQNLDGMIDELREVSKLNEGTKRNMAGVVGNLTDNLQTVDEAPEKAKKHLLQMVQNINGKIDEQQELSKPIMNEVCDAPGEAVKDNYDLNYLTQMVDELGVKITEFKKKQVCDVGEALKVDDNLNNYWAVRLLELKAKKRSVRRVQNLDEMIHEQQVLSKLIMNEIRDAPGESVNDNDDLNYVKEVVAKLEDRITEFKKKQGDDSFTDQLYSANSSSRGPRRISYACGN